jgi:hypothetical protein
MKLNLLLQKIRDAELDRLPLFILNAEMCMISKSKNQHLFKR